MTRGYIVSALKRIRSGIPQKTEIKNKRLKNPEVKLPWRRNYETHEATVAQIIVLTRTQKPDIRRRNNSHNQNRNKR